MTVSLKLSVTLSDPSCGPENSVLEYDGHITAYCDTTDQSQTVGRTRAFVANIEAALSFRFSPIDSLDSREETAPYLALLSFEQPGNFAPRVQAVLGEPDTFSLNMLIVDRIEILPEHRGLGYGLTAMESIISHLGPGCRIAAIKPYPLQFEPKRTWKPEMQLGRYTGTKSHATQRLKNLYAHIDFKSVGRTGLMIRDLLLR